MESFELKKIKKSNLVTQSNNLVEARYSLTLYEQRLVLMMISMVEPQDEDFKDYKIRVSDFNKILGLKHKGSYNKIKNILRGLRAKELLINKGERDYLVTGWVSDAEYIDKEGYVLLSFSKKLKPYLLALKDNFTSQRLNTLIHFKGTYTIRIYALLKQYEKIGVREVFLADFKEMLGLQSTQYPDYGNFKRRIISPALKEFSKKDEQGTYLSDINFRLETKRKERKINVLIFHIIKQDTRKQQIKLINPNTSILGEYEALGIKEATTLPFLKKDGEEALREVLSIFKKDKEAGKIRSSEQGYLVKLLKAGAGVRTQEEIEEEKRKKELAEEKRRKEKNEALEKKTLSLSKEYLKLRKEEYLSTLPEEDLAVLLNSFREKHKDNKLFYNLKVDVKTPYLQAELNNHIKAQVTDYKEKEIAYLNQNMMDSLF